MPSRLQLIIRSPYQFICFLYSFAIQAILILGQRILLPTHPRYQSLRIELNRAYLSSCSFHFPDFTHRLPADYGVDVARPVSAEGFLGYLIPACDPTSLFESARNGNACVVLYAHGGGYARGVARMYTRYMERWEQKAHRRGLQLVFLSVEYTLSTEAPHPTQRTEFLAAYKYLLANGVPSQKICFMGDSAGGGLCINSAIYALNHQIPQPAASILVSPWVDLTMSSFVGGNLAANSDYFIQMHGAVPALVKLICGNMSPTDPDINPLFARRSRLRGLNPQLIFVGAAEFALQDSKSWADRCKEAAVKHELEVGYGQLHIWAMGSKWIEPQLRELTDDRILNWILQHIK